VIKSMIFIASSVLLAQSAQAQEPVPANSGKAIFLENFYYTAPQEKPVFRSYEDQFSFLVKSAISPSAEHVGQDSDGVKCLKEIAHLFDSGKMLLKNVVYRSDTGYIRITFASNDDRYVIKGTYGTSFDDVLVNSNYADKKKLIDLKIMYLPDGEKKYKYFHIFNSSRKQQPGGERLIGVEPETTGATCKYCHQLAKISGEPSGLFFQRYQYGSDAKPLHSSFLVNQMPGIFKDSNFKSLPSKPAWMPPEFSDSGVRYNITSVSKSGVLEISKFVQKRNLILESPELLETFSLDNRQSYCIAFSWPDLKGVVGMDYVCTDYPKRMVYVRINRQGDNKLIKYVHPFYKKPDLGEIAYKNKVDEHSSK